MLYCSRNNMNMDMLNFRLVESVGGIVKICWVMNEWGIESFSFYMKIHVGKYAAIWKHRQVFHCRFTKKSIFPSNRIFKVDWRITVVKTLLSLKWMLVHFLIYKSSLWQLLHAPRFPLKPHTDTISTDK